MCLGSSKKDHNLHGLGPISVKPTLLMGRRTYVHTQCIQNYSHNYGTILNLFFCMFINKDAMGVKHVVDFDNIQGERMKGQATPQA